MNVYFDDFQVVHITGPVLEENHYYPFGMLNAQLSAQPVTKPLNFYKYNNKELQKELSLELLDYGARFYDPVIGRFIVVDPKVEEYTHSSSYAYAACDPIKHIDVNGKNPILIIGGILITSTDIALISAGVITSGIILQKAQHGGFKFNSSMSDFLKSDQSLLIMWAALNTVNNTGLDWQSITVSWT